MNAAIELIIAKGVFNHSLLHRLTNEYLAHCIRERTLGNDSKSSPSCRPSFTHSRWSSCGKDLHLARYLERSNGVTVTLFWYLRSYVTKLNLVNSGYHQKFRSTRHLDLSVRARPYGFVGAIRH